MQNDATPNQLAIDLGIQNLPLPEQEEILADFADIVQAKLSDKWVSELTEDQLGEIDRLSAEDNESALVAFLSEHFPNYAETLEQIITETKSELQGQAARLTGYLKQADDAATPPAA